MDAALLVLTAIAALGGVTGLVIVRWMWIDRPGFRWNLGIARYPVERPISENAFVIGTAKPDEAHRVDIDVSMIGNAVMHDVRIRGVGCQMVPQRHPTVTNQTGAIRVSATLPADDGTDAYLEIRWVEMRPRRERAVRYNLRNKQFLKWKWYRLRPNSGRWVSVKWLPKDHRQIPGSF